jgi:hypothetical protein
MVVTGEGGEAESERHSKRFRRSTVSDINTQWIAVDPAIDKRESEKNTDWVRS